LHLDLHPWNILVEAGEVVAVIDWANAASGRPILDKARTTSILTLDPAACARRIDERWRVLSDAWLEEIEGDLDDNTLAWACRYMLNDLGSRYRRRDLAPVRQRLNELEGRP
jgi:aminoglycoside phosphotransferase (APT) family kinase protein